MPPFPRQERCSQAWHWEKLRPCTVPTALFQEQSLAPPGLGVALPQKGTISYIPRTDWPQGAP